MSLFNNKLNKVPLGMLDQDVQDKFTATETQLAQIVTNVKSFGAKGDFVQDDTTFIQNAINSLASTGGNVYLPNGRYKITNTLTLPNEVFLVGQSKYNTIIDDNGGLLNKPLISNSNYGTATANKDIGLKNLSVYSQGVRTVYTISFQNTNNVIVDNAYICENNGQSASTSLHGLEVTTANGYAGNVFVARITNSRFSQATLKLNATDSYVRGNELWGNYRVGALDLTLANNTMVTNNQIVGGVTYGGIYCTSDTSALKIETNYFDGSYYNLNTMWGIYSVGMLDRCIINGNNFWNVQKGGIYAKTIQLCTVVGNIFDECDKFDAGYSDIKLDSTTPGSSWGNVITNNTHKRQYAYNQSTGAQVTRSNPSPPPVLDLYQVSGSPPNIIAHNNLAYTQYYSASKYNGGQYYVGTNGHTYFTDTTNLSSITRYAKQTFVFVATNIGASANTNAQFNGVNNIILGNSGIVLALGISMGTARTAGSVTALLNKNGTYSGSSVTMAGNGGNNFTYQTTYSNGSGFKFGAQDNISIGITSTSDFTPTGNTVVVSLTVAFDQ